MTITDTTPGQRLNAWEELGQRLVPTKNAQAALDAAGLSGWNVRKAELIARPIITGTEDVHTKISVPDTFAIVRDNPKTGEPESLGTVGRYYHPVQNEDQIALLEALVDESGATFTSAGELRGGRTTFVTMELPEAIKVGGHDDVKLYLATFNSHDGQSSFRFVITPIRVSCANMQAAAVRSAVGSFTARHTAGGAKFALEQARQTLGMTFNYVDDFALEAQRLFEEEYTERQFIRLTASLFPTPDTASDTKKEAIAEHRSQLMKLWQASPTAETIRGTKWAALQAVTEYTDHIVTLRRKSPEELRRTRAERAVAEKSDTARLKARTRELLLK